MKQFLRHFLVPHESNNHRPKLLHLEVLVVLLAFLFSALITMAGVEHQYPAVLGDATSISIQDLLNDTNMKRQANGLSPLKMNDKLSHAADLKAHDMFAKNYWAHVAPDGTTPWVWIKDSGYQYLYAGENLARGYNTGDDVVNAWMNSPSHRENLLSPNYSDIGFAVMPGSLTGSKTVLVVQMFGSPYSESAAKLDNPEVAMAATTPTIIPRTPNVSQVPVVAPIQNITPQPTITVEPTKSLAAAGIPEGSTPLAGVAAIQNKPLVDASTVKHNMSFFFLLLLISVLIIDTIIIERRKIARVFAHNIDHIMFLLFVLLAGIIIGRGVIV